jgi:His-Xaa-Ser system radical SAM maturase HxsB
LSKFLDLSAYQHDDTSEYSLLPARFTRLEDRKYIVTNLVGEWIEIDRDDVEKYISHKLEPHSNVYNDLKSKHLLMDQGSSIALDMLALKWRTKLSRLSDFTGLHMFVASLRCEHSCPYCQVSRQSEDRDLYDMSETTADAALDLVFRSPAPAIKIEFQGGEPLLNFEIIKYVVEKAKDINVLERRNLAFVVATNLAVIDDDMLSYFREHDVLISTSLDGPADLHNANRPRPGKDSYERAVDGIERVRLALGRDRVSALMTTTEASLDRSRDIIDEYLRLGFDTIFLRPLSPYGFAVKTKWYGAYNAERWLKFYFEGLDYIVELNKQGNFFVEQYAATILAKMLTPFEPGYVDLMSPAGIGIGAVVYNYDGDVYASDEGRMLAEMGKPKFKLGNVLENTYEEIFLSDALLDPLEDSYADSVPMCHDCAFQPFCGSDPVFHYATQGDTVGHKPTSEFCMRNMAIFKRLISMMRDPEIKRIFMGWVSH